MTVEQKVPGTLILATFIERTPPAPVNVPPPTPEEIDANHSQLREKMGQLPDNWKDVIAVMSQFPQITTNFLLTLDHIHQVQGTVDLNNLDVARHKTDGVGFDKKPRKAGEIETVWETGETGARIRNCLSVAREGLYLMEQNEPEPEWPIDMNHIIEWPIETCLDIACNDKVAIACFEHYGYSPEEIAIMRECAHEQIKNSHLRTQKDQALKTLQIIEATERKMAIEYREKLRALRNKSDQ